MKMASSYYKPIGTYTKYHNTKVIYKGIKFDSKRERNRYKELVLLKNAEIISSLELQKKFELQPSYKKNGKTIRSISYIADFYYYDNVKRQYVVEDTKGVKTDVYKIKKKMFEYKYNLTIKEL